MTVYFDNSATTKVCPEAIEAMTAMMAEDYGNPSSTHLLGRRAKALLDTFRAKVADAIGAKNDEIFFTSGGTESDNWAILGTAELMRHNGKHIITTATEHDAVLKTVEKLKTKGYEVTYLMPNPKTGRVSAEDLMDAIREDTVLVSVMLVNNETGALNPISEMAKVIKKKNSQAILHTDAVQGFCKVPVSVKTLGADLVTLSSHKIHGPKGVGALYVRKGLRLPAIITGGGQEGGYRSGTEPLPAIAGFAAAAAKGTDSLQKDEAHMRELSAFTAEAIKERLPDAVFIGEGDAPHILSVSLPGYKSEVLMNFLDAAGICVSKGSACKKGRRSHVLEAMKVPVHIIDGAIRVSFCGENTKEEAEYFVNNLVEACSKLRKVLR